MGSAVVLLSGGLDSTVCLGMAVNECGAQNVLALSLSYGQRHDKEVKAADKITSYYGTGHRFFDVSQLFALNTSSALLRNEKEMPKLSYEELNKASGPSPTYVPYRNGLFLSIASCIALQEGFDSVYYGAHSEDAHNWAYPDCTAEFNGAQANAIYVGTYHKLRLITPLQWMSKAEVVEQALRIGSPVGLTWSCYQGREKACGLCPTCVGRLQAFRANKIADPVEYEIPLNWEGHLQWTIK